MYKPNSIRLLSFLCIGISIIGLILQLLANQWGMLGIDIIKWLFMIYAGYLGFRLSYYKLYDEELKKITLRLLLSPIIAIILLFISGLLAIVVAVVYMSWLYTVKSNYDDWDTTES
jgi:hypothetical protein